MQSSLVKARDSRRCGATAVTTYGMFFIVSETGVKNGKEKKNKTFDSTERFSLVYSKEIFGAHSFTAVLSSVLSAVSRSPAVAITLSSTVAPRLFPSFAVSPSVSFSFASGVLRASLPLSLSAFPSPAVSLFPSSIPFSTILFVASVVVARGQAFRLAFSSTASVWASVLLSLSFATIGRRRAGVPSTSSTALFFSFSPLPSVQTALFSPLSLFATAFAFVFSSREHYTSFSFSCRLFHLFFFASRLRCLFSAIPFLFFFLLLLVFAFENRRKEVFRRLRTRRQLFCFDCLFFFFLLLLFLS